MTFRIIKGLAWAQLAESPWGQTKRRRGTKAQGLTYQRQLGRALPQALAGQWFAFIDSFGQGHCQPDFLLDAQGCIYILEAKLTDWPEAKGQAELLYKPIVQHVYWPRPVRCIVVAKNLSHKTDRKTIATSLPEAIFLSHRSTPVWHCPWPSLAHIPPNIGHAPQVPLATREQSLKIA